MGRRLIDSHNDARKIAEYFTDALAYAEIFDDLANEMAACFIESSDFYMANRKNRKARKAFAQLLRSHCESRKV